MCKQIYISTKTYTSYTAYLILRTYSTRYLLQMSIWGCVGSRKKAAGFPLPMPIIVLVALFCTAPLPAFAIITGALKRLFVQPPPAPNYVYVRAHARVCQCMCMHACVSMYTHCTCMCMHTRASPRHSRSDPGTRRIRVDGQLFCFRWPKTRGGGLRRITIG
jgi:hypothetical protein